MAVIMELYFLTLVYIFLFCFISYSKFTVWGVLLRWIGVSATYLYDRMMIRVIMTTPKSVSTFLGFTNDCYFLIYGFVHLQCGPITYQLFLAPADSIYGTLSQLFLSNSIKYKYQRIELQLLAFIAQHPIDRRLQQPIIIRMHQIRESQEQYLSGSLISPQSNHSCAYRFFSKFDFFSFLPVPKDDPVSTRASLIGSIIFLILFFIYLGISFYFFVIDNPPAIQTYSVKLDDKLYTLPRVSVAFMEGQTLNQTDLYQQYFNFTFTKQLKSTSKKYDTPIEMMINDPQDIQWITNQTAEAYQILRSPKQPMFAKGLLYSSNTCNYTKLSVKMCNVNAPNNTCASIDAIRSLSAKGRIFLFIQDKGYNVSVSKQNKQNQNKFTIANFFLQPGHYKRVTVSFKIINTQVFPDYFNRFKKQYSTQLVVDYITQQSSNTSYNDQQLKRTPLEMLSIVFQLSPEVHIIRMSYLTILDHLAKWAAFFNLLFTIFAIFLLGYNRKKFYQKNPEWEKFRKVTKKKLRMTSEHK